MPMMPPRAVCRSPPASSPSSACCSLSPANYTSWNFSTFFVRQHRLHATATTATTTTTSTAATPNESSPRPKGDSSFSLKVSASCSACRICARCTMSTEKSLGRAKEEVPLPCHSGSQVKLPKYLIRSPSRTAAATGREAGSGCAARRSPSTVIAADASTTFSQAPPSCLKTARRETAAVLQPRRRRLRRPPSWEKSSRGRSTFMRASSMRTARATKPFSGLLEVGGRATPSSLPSWAALLGPSSSRKKSPFAMSCGYGSQAQLLQRVVSPGTLPAAQAQSSKVPAAGQTTSSIVPTRKGVRPRDALWPPARWRRSAMSMRMGQSGVWLSAACACVPQLKATSLPPLCSATVRSKRYFRKSRSSTCVAVARQHTEFPSTGKSRFTSTSPGKVLRRLCKNPDGFAIGKYTIRGPRRCGQAYSSACGPMNSSPCMPDTSSTVCSPCSPCSPCYPCCAGDSKQKNSHLAPQHCSASRARCETSWTCWAGTMAFQRARYSRQSEQRWKGAQAERWSTADSTSAAFKTPLQTISGVYIIISHRSPTAPEFDFQI